MRWRVSVGLVRLEISWIDSGNGRIQGTAGTEPSKESCRKSRPQHRESPEELVQPDIALPVPASFERFDQHLFNSQAHLVTKEPAEVQLLRSS